MQRRGVRCLSVRQERLLTNIENVDNIVIPPPVVSAEHEQSIVDEGAGAATAEQVVGDVKRRRMADIKLTGF